MPRHDSYREAKFKQISDEVCRILGSLDRHELGKVEKQLEKLDIDMDYCCEHPDVLCSILRIACGRSYVELIRSASK